MADINYVKSYSSSTDTRAFAQSFLGTLNRTPIKIFLGGYTKQYEAGFTGQYSKQYEGSFGAQYSKLYVGSYTKHYEKQWSGVYEGVFEGYYDRDFIGQYTKTYTGQYTGLFTGQFTAHYAKAYLGNYTKQYGKVWLGLYTKTYEGEYGTSYQKLYGGAYSGATAGGNEVVAFTNSFVGALSYNTSYVNTTTAANTMSGELTDGGVTRIREDGELKRVKSTRVKVGDEWKEVVFTRIKENDQWKIVGVNYERNTKTITSNTSVFSVKDHLTSIGANFGSKPQHLVITVNSGKFVHGTSANAAIDVTGLSAVGGVNHKVKVLLKPGSYVIGAGGTAGTQNASTRTGGNGTDGGHAIQLGNGVDLSIENYGILAGGGGGGGSGGYPVEGDTSTTVGGLGGVGAGWSVSSNQYISESNASRNGTDSAVKYGVHGGDGGLLGQYGKGAGGFDADNPALNESKTDTSYSLYAQSGDGGTPGSAIKGYVASRVSFINNTESSVWGDNAFKLKA